MVVSFLQSRAGRSLCAGAVSALIAGERDRDRSSSAHSINETIATNARRLVRDLPDKSHHRLPLLAALGAGLPAPVAAAELGCSRSYAYAAKQVDVSASDLFERAPHDVTVRSHRPPASRRHRTAIALADGGFVARLLTYSARRCIPSNWMRPNRLLPIAARCHRAARGRTIASSSAIANSTTATAPTISTWRRERLPSPFRRSRSGSRSALDCATRRSRLRARAKCASASPCRRRSGPSIIGSAASSDGRMTD